LTGRITILRERECLHRSVERRGKQEAAITIELFDEMPMMKNLRQS